MWFPKGGLLVLDDLMAEGENDKRCWMFSPKIPTITASKCSAYAKTCFCRGNMPRVFPELHRSLQESTRAIRHEELSVTSVSHPMASFTRHVSTFDRTSVRNLLKDEGCMRCHKFIETSWLVFPKDSITTVFLNNGSKKSAQLVNRDFVVPIGCVVCLLPLSVMVSSPDVF